MINLDSRIKVVYNRCENELKPKLKAIDISSQHLNDELIKANQQLQEL